MSQRAPTPTLIRVAPLRRRRAAPGVGELLASATRSGDLRRFAADFSAAMSSACGGAPVQVYGPDIERPVELAATGPLASVGARPALGALLRGAVSAPPRVIPLRLGGVTVAYAVIYVDPLPHGPSMRQLVSVGALGFARWQATAQAHAERTERDRLVHDFKSPAASIELAATELLFDDGLSEANRELIDLMAKQARTLQDRALRLLTARGASGQCNLAQAAEEVVAAALPSARSQGRELHLLCLDQPLVRTDALDATRAVENLVMNALHHTPHGTAVQVVVAIDHGEAVCEVRDAGNGLSDAQLAAMIEDGGRGAESGGQGLGLGIARAVATAAGGSLRLSSTPGEGATFTLRLPLGQDRRGG